MASSGGLCLLALGLQREVDHHDGVLLHNSDQKNDADQRDDIQVLFKHNQASIAPTPADGSVERIVMG